MARYCSAQFWPSIKFSTKIKRAISRNILKLQAYSLRLISHRPIRSLRFPNADYLTHAIQLEPAHLHTDFFRFSHYCRPTESAGMTLALCRVYSIAKTANAIPKARVHSTYKSKIQKIFVIEYILCKANDTLADSVRRQS